MKITYIVLSVLLEAIIEDENLTTIDELRQHLEDNSNEYFRIDERSEDEEE